jgi:hypothetical protein
MSYNERWTKDKFIEYRKLKRNGYSQEMLIEHFGDDIYYSGIYSKKSTIMPWLEFITEIKITPEKTNYNISKKKSDIYSDKIDFIINFKDNENDYIISLFYYEIDSIETYNVLLTTKNQWNNYQKRLNEFRQKGFITDEERVELVSIVEKETEYNQLYSVIKKVSYILLDFLKNNLNNIIISIGETKNIVKINLYRSIIKNSFDDVKELGEKFDTAGNKYFLYEIK